MINEELKKTGESFVASSTGWTFDITDKDYGVYSDETATARVFMDGAGTWFSPCYVWIKRMNVEPKDATADISPERIELITDRIRRALKLLKIKFREQ